MDHESLSLIETFQICTDLPNGLRHLHAVTYRTGDGCDTPVVVMHDRTTRVFDIVARQLHLGVASIDPRE